MIAWIAGIGSFLKGLFGPKGATQIGKGNQAVTGSTTGDNSPMVSAGRDVHLNVLAGAADDDADLFRELEKTMPDILDELRRHLAEMQRNPAEHPPTWTVIVMDTKGEVIGQPGIRFNEDEEPGARSKIEMLKNYGLLECVNPKYEYRMTWRLFKYLKKF